MKYPHLFIVGFLLVACAAVLSIHGCTLHFKASEVELKTEQPVKYDLEKVDLFGGKVAKHSTADSSRYNPAIK